MKILLNALLIFISIISACTKYSNEQPGIEKTEKLLLNADLTTLKPYLKGNWNLNYKRQMFDTTIVRVYNNKIAFNNNVDSIKWLVNNNIIVNSAINYTYDTSPVITVLYTNRINFSNAVSNFSWAAERYYNFEKRIALIDYYTKTIYFLDKE